MFSETAVCPHCGSSDVEMRATVRMPIMVEDGVPWWDDEGLEATNTTYHCLACWEGQNLGDSIDVLKIIDPSLVSE